MEYNICKTCGANNGRAGNLINGECMNCYRTRESGEVSVHAFLQRTPEELEKTMKIIDDEKEHSK